MTITVFPDVHQTVQDIQEFADVVHMEAGGGFIQNIEGSAGPPPGKFLGQLDPLGLAAGQGGGRLTDADIADPHIHQGLQLVADTGDIFKKFQPLVDRHVQHVIDVFPLVPDLQGLPVVTPAVAHIAGHKNIRQKMHLDLDDAVAAAGLATAALDVKAETPGLVSPHPGFRGFGKQFPDECEHAGIGAGIGAGGPADGRLIDIDHLVEKFDALDDAMFPGGAPA